MFYAEAWLAVHYLIARPDRVFVNDLATYLTELEKGTDPLNAFKHGFGIDHKEFDRKLKKYRRKGQIRSRHARRLVQLHQVVAFQESPFT